MNPTLNRFYSFHFLFPFILTFFILIHLLTLHEKGSSNPSNINSNLDKIDFKSFFILKDSISLFLILILLSLINLLSPNLLGDPENFNLANPLVTPIHIQPEWYFLFAYAILRSIPNKLGGVIFLLLRIVILYFLPFKKSFIIQRKFNLKFKFFINLIIISFLVLTWIGANPVEAPYENLGQFFSFFYFFSFLTF